jgi:hypothetical protein
MREYRARKKEELKNNTKQNKTSIINDEMLE